jgi:hypothetical protein
MVRSEVILINPMVLHLTASADIPQSPSRLSQRRGLKKGATFLIILGRLIQRLRMLMILRL